MEFTEQQKEVRRWLERRRGILLAHNYQPGEIQDVADFLGDSLALSMTAAKTPAEVIVFCGVHFMAETAAILCPDKTVLLPREDVGCYMAATITAEQLRARKAELPGVPVVTYVNSTAAVKAESDICCTSANVVQVVNSLTPPRVLMVPDRNLALYTARRTAKEDSLLGGLLQRSRRPERRRGPGLPGGPSPGGLHRPSRVPPRSPGPGPGDPQHQRHAPVCPPVLRPRIHHRHGDGHSPHLADRKPG